MHDSESAQLSAAAAAAAFSDCRIRHTERNILKRVCSDMSDRMSPLLLFVAVSFLSSFSLRQSVFIRYHLALIS